MACAVSGAGLDRLTCSVWPTVDRLSAEARAFAIIATMKFLLMKPGHGEVLLAEGDVSVPAQEEQLVAAFRAQLDSGKWAAVPTVSAGGRREAEMVRNFRDIPRDAERVIFFPRAAGGC